MEFKIFLSLLTHVKHGFERTYVTANVKIVFYNEKFGNSTSIHTSTNGSILLRTGITRRGPSES